MVLWSSCSSEPQTSKCNWQKGCFVGKEKKIESAKEFGLLSSEDAQVWGPPKNSFPYVLWFYVGGSITTVEALNIPVGHLINRLITPGHGKASLWKSGYQRYRHCLLLLRQHNAVKCLQLCVLLWPEKRCVPHGWKNSRAVHIRP